MGRWNEQIGRIVIWRITSIAIVVVVPVDRDGTVTGGKRRRRHGRGRLEQEMATLWLERKQGAKVVTESNDHFRKRRMKEGFSFSSFDTDVVSHSFLCDRKDPDPPEKNPDPDLLCEKPTTKHILVHNKMHVNQSKCNNGDVLATNPWTVPKLVAASWFVTALGKCVGGEDKNPHRGRRL